MVMTGGTIRRGGMAALLCALGFLLAALSATAATLPGKPPVATDDPGYSTSSDAPVAGLSVPAPGLLANDISPTTPLASLTVVKVADPAHGSVTVNPDGPFP